jgi:hypothetical protein
VQAIVWWTVPLVAFVVAIVWVSVANRPKPPVDPHDSVAEHERFRDAMERQTGRPTGPGAGRRPGRAPHDDLPPVEPEDDPPEWGTGRSPRTP